MYDGIWNDTYVCILCTELRVDKIYIHVVSQLTPELINFSSTYPIRKFN